MTSTRVLTALLAATLAGAAVSGCSPKQSAPSGAGAVPQVTVKATDTSCELSVTEGKAGTTTFAVTNSGNTVTEVYVYGGGQRVLAEAENISTGLHREISVPLTAPGRYEVACKPGMVGDGIRAAYTVTG